MPEIRSTATRIARAARAKDPVAESNARRDHAEALIQAYVQKVLAAAPPLTDEQRSRLAELLRPVRVSGA